MLNPFVSSTGKVEERIEGRPVTPPPGCPDLNALTNSPGMRGAIESYTSEELDNSEKPSSRYPYVTYKVLGAGSYGAAVVLSYAGERAKIVKAARGIKGRKANKDEHEASNYFKTIIGSEDIVVSRQVTPDGELMELSDLGKADMLTWLQDKIDTKTHISVAEVSHFFKWLDSILEKMKGKVAHRDLKPDNIIFFNPKPGVNQYKMIDFGLSSRPGETDALRTCGSPGFVALSISFLHSLSRKKRAPGLVEIFSSVELYGSSQDQGSIACIKMLVALCFATTHSCGVKYHSSFYDGNNESGFQYLRQNFFEIVELALNACVQGEVTDDVFAKLVDACTQNYTSSIAGKLTQIAVELGESMEVKNIFTEVLQAITIEATSFRAGVLEGARKFLSMQTSASKASNALAGAFLRASREYSGIFNEVEWSPVDMQNQATTCIDMLAGLYSSPSAGMPQAAIINAFEKYRRDFHDNAYYALHVYIQGNVTYNMFRAFLDSCFACYIHLNRKALQFLDGTLQYDVCNNIFDEVFRAITIEATSFCNGVLKGVEISSEKYPIVSKFSHTLASSFLKALRKQPGMDESQVKIFEKVKLPVGSQNQASTCFYMLAKLYSFENSGAEPKAIVAAFRQYRAKFVQEAISDLKAYLENQLAHEKFEERLSSHCANYLAVSEATLKEISVKLKDTLENKLVFDGFLQAVSDEVNDICSGVLDAAKEISLASESSSANASPADASPAKACSDIPSNSDGNQTDGVKRKGSPNAGGYFLRRKASISPSGKQPSTSFSGPRC